MDLHAAYGIDLLDFFRGVYSWRKFYNLIRRLPNASHFAASQRNDPEFAEWVLAQAEEDQPAWTPSPAEWTTLHEMTATSLDLLGVAIARLTDLQVQDGLKKRTKPPTRFPRPVTAIEKAQRLERERRHSDTINWVKASQERYAQLKASGELPSFRADEDGS